MNTPTSGQFLEAIDHHTLSRPFGIYHIDIPKEESCALYIHCHTEAEFFCLKTGQLDFVIEDEHYSLSAGDCIFIPPMLIHGAFKDTCSECSFTAIVFATELVSSYYAASTYISVIGTHPRQCIYYVNRNLTENKRLLSVLDLIPDSDDYDLYSNELTIVGSFFIICQELYNLCFSKIKETGGSQNIEPAIEYIKGHFNENITLKELAAITGFSEGYFGHFFTAQVGISPFAYINKVRIANAANLFSTTDLSVTSVASASGFDNISYFNRTFKKIMGVTPSAYKSRQIINL